MIEVNVPAAFLGGGLFSIPCLVLSAEERGEFSAVLDGVFLFTLQDESWTNVGFRLDLPVPPVIGLVKTTVATQNKAFVLGLWNAVKHFVWRNTSVQLRRIMSWQEPVFERSLYILLNSEHEARMAYAEPIFRFDLPRKWIQEMTMEIASCRRSDERYIVPICLLPEDWRCKLGADRT
jgi:hypothetical protein